MGVFDRLWDTDGNEWQTKALGRGHGSFHIGDRIPGPARTVQVQVMGRVGGVHIDGHATIVDGILTQVPAPLDTTLPQRDYCGAEINDPRTPIERVLDTFPNHSAEHAAVRRLIGYAHEYASLTRELATPPDGWYPFGRHLDQNVQLEFWGDLGGIPIFERPIPVPPRDAGTREEATDAEGTLNSLNRA